MVSLCYGEHSAVVNLGCGMEDRTSPFLHSAFPKEDACPILWDVVCEENTALCLSVHGMLVVSLCTEGQLHLLPEKSQEVGSILGCFC